MHACTPPCMHEGICVCVCVWTKQFVLSIGKLQANGGEWRVRKFMPRSVWRDIAFWIIF